MRRGFTLLELLMVLTIIALVAGISFGAVIASQRTTGLESAETLITGLVRQARHTALSTGAPVELRIERNQSSGRWQVAGVSQIIVASETFDFNDDGTRRTAQDTPRPVAGVSGYGWVGNAVPESMEAKVLPFDRRRPLLRRPGDGFYISCWYRPPPIRDPGLVGTDVGLQFYRPGATSDAYRGRIVRYIPLVLLGSEDPNTALAGLTLELREILVQTGPKGEQVKSLFWAVAGWVGDAQNRLVLADVDGTHGSDEMRNPIDPNDWSQIGLHYDGQEYRLEVNGRFLISSRELTGGPNNVGDIRLDASEIAGLDAAYIAHADNGAPGTIDNIRILRLGYDHPSPLPSGILPIMPYRIVADGGGVALYAEVNADPSDPTSVPDLQPRDSLLFGSPTSIAEVERISAAGDATFVSAKAHLAAGGRTSDRTMAVRVTVDGAGHVSSTMGVLRR